MQRISALALTLTLLGVPGFAAARTPNPQPQEQQQQKEKAKKKPKKDEPVAGPGESTDLGARERSAITRVLRDFADGFEGNSPRRVEEDLDERLEDLQSVEDKVNACVKQQ